MGLPLSAKPAWLVLLISISVSFFAAYVTDQQARKTGQAQFERQVELLRLDIQHQLLIYSGLLRAGVGLFYASENVTRSEWRLFVGTLALDRHYPGIQGIGYAAYLARDDKPAFEAAITAEGFARFAIAPAGQRAFYTPVTYLEPFTWRNQRAFGYDMFSEPVRREAIARARDTGQASVSGHVTLVQETDEDVQAGFLMYVPVYRTREDPGSQVLRAQSIQGFVYAPFRMGRLLAAITEGKPNTLHFRITDQPSGALLYDSSPGMSSAPGRYTAAVTMEMGGRAWRLDVQATPLFDGQQRDYGAAWVLAAGLVGSLLLFIIALTLAGHRRAAQAHADRMARQLALSEKFRHMADAAPTALVVVDPGGRIELCNQQAVALLGGPESALLQRPMDEFLPAKAAQLIGQQGQVVNCRSLEGVQCPVELSQRQAPLNGLIYTVYALVDVTERKRQEDLLRRKTRDLEQFVYAVSHDLKSPLVAITGLSEVLALQPAVADDPEARQLLGRITANSRQMEQLLQDLLALSRVSHQVLPLEYIDWASLLDDVQATHKAAFDAVGARLQLEALGDGFWGLRTLIMQLFNNLLQNAINYRDIDRPLKVTVACTTNHRGQTSIQVSDNGIGIETEWQEKVFQLFMRRDSRKTPGSGLGLAICEAVVERHQGRIWLESTLGEGTRFYIELPNLKE
ncbi:CHASE domain-containing protein [Simiduia sp. 21SJ11W-1]|uniref:CHASE domain-containing protein n=1 Tax=Simiduia sp. 21SJ11W-1 TaxID=2909669 RepID=UPI00209D4689|nr:CHASE domain-containing protein [Simiduia sp. 21SJ11W-1]UTA47517.1 CHASE domain-containing protein [Simiduia sp. 21SJ11W-1]